jgi:polyhydroxyalkanoate synthase subunit PhaC
LRKRFGKVFDEKFREEKFFRSLSDIVSDNSELVKIIGLGKIYQYLSNELSVWNNNYVEPIRDILYRTPSQKICELEKCSLFHYDKPALPISGMKNAQMQNHDYREKNKPLPVLVIYAFIKRHSILDFLPEISVVRNLLYQGLDIFATDWGTPSEYDKTLTIGHC